MYKFILLHKNHLLTYFETWIRFVITPRKFQNNIGKKTTYAHKLIHCFFISSGQSGCTKGWETLNAGSSDNLDDISFIRGYCFTST